MHRGAGLDPPSCTIYHAAVASIVLLVLRYASRRERSRRRGNLYASEGTGGADDGAGVQHVFVAARVRASFFLPLSLVPVCFYLSRSLSLFFFLSLRYNVILSTKLGQAENVTACVTKNVETRGGNRTMHMRFDFFNCSFCPFLLCALVISRFSRQKTIGLPRTN